METEKTDELAKVMAVILNRTIELARNYLPQKTSITITIDHPNVKADIITIAVPTQAKSVSICINGEGNIEIYGSTKDYYDKITQALKNTIYLSDPESLGPTLELKILSSFI